MRLIRYKVTNFRSVEDSGWIETDRVTALIGVNESGKTNLLIPLWKFNPAREGEIQPTSDTLRNILAKYVRLQGITVLFSSSLILRETHRLLQN
jgi:ABC-type branched-subunit amino acid transport system ATPase component